MTRFEIDEFKEELKKSKEAFDTALNMGKLDIYLNYILKDIFGLLENLTGIIESLNDTLELKEDKENIED